MPQPSLKKKESPKSLAEPKPEDKLSLGAVVRKFRLERQWKLSDLSKRSGIALSTLSKVENDIASLTYDRLQQVAAAFGLSLAEFVSEPDAPPMADAGARIGWARAGSGTKIDTGAYHYTYLCDDLRTKAIQPILCECRAKTLKEFGPLLKHGGEEFIFVVKGQVAIHTEYYRPQVLAAGEGVYIDSRMGHAYLKVGTDDALILSANFQPNLATENAATGDWQERHGSATQR